MTDRVHEHDPECAVAHGELPHDPGQRRELVAVYATPLATTLLSWGRELGFTTGLVEPDDARISAAARAAADAIHTDPGDVEVGAWTDVVVTDHHRDDLGPVLAPLVRAQPRWIGIMGSVRHVGPHIAALRGEGVPDELIATVHRPVGLDIGSKAPPEIALATLAGLLADRNGRAGGFPRPASATATSA